MADNADLAAGIAPAARPSGVRTGEAADEFAAKVIAWRESGYDPVLSPWRVTRR